MHFPGTSNINCSTVVLIIDVCRFSWPVSSNNYGVTDFKPCYNPALFWVLSVLCNKNSMCLQRIENLHRLKSRLFIFYKTVFRKIRLASKWNMTFLGHSMGTISGVLEHLKMSNGNSRFISLKPSLIPVSGRNLPVLNFAYHLPNWEPTAFSLAWISSDHFQSLLLHQPDVVAERKKRLEAIGWNSG